MLHTFCKGWEAPFIFSYDINNFKTINHKQKQTFYSTLFHSIPPTLLGSQSYVCVWWQRRGSVTGPMAAGGEEPGEDMTGWKKPPQCFRTETQADKKTHAGIQSNSQFCCSQHKHATSPWHTRFSSLLATLAKNFSSSFRTEEGSKQTLSARHEVST